MSIEAPDRPDIIDDLEQQFEQSAADEPQPAQAEKVGGLAFVPSEVTVGVRGLSNFLDMQNPQRRQTYRIPVGNILFRKPGIPPSLEEYERLIRLIRRRGR